MADIARQYGQTVKPRRRGDDDVAESRCLALAARPIGQAAGDPGRRRIEGEDTVTIEMQDRLKPCPQIGALARRAFAPQPDDSVFDLRHRNRR